MTGWTRDFSRRPDPQAASPPKWYSDAREVVALADALQEDGIDPVRLQDVVELVEAAECVVAFDGDVPPEPPPGRQGEQALRLDAAAPAVEPVAPGWINVVKRRSVLIDASELEGVLAADVPERHTMPPIAHPQHAVLGRVHGMEREIVVRRKREIVGHLGR